MPSTGRPENLDRQRPAGSTPIADRLSKAELAEVGICDAHMIRKPDAVGQVRSHRVFRALARNDLEPLQN